MCDNKKKLFNNPNFERIFIRSCNIFFLYLYDLGLYTTLAENANPAVGESEGLSPLIPEPTAGHNPESKIFTRHSQNLYPKGAF
jgi:hypothetical protein